MQSVLNWNNIMFPTDEDELILQNQQVIQGLINSSVTDALSQDLWSQLSLYMDDSTMDAKRHIFFLKSAQLEVIALFSLTQAM